MRHMGRQKSHQLLAAISRIIWTPLIGTYKQALRPERLAFPIPGTSIRIIDPDALEEFATGGRGLVLISGAKVIHGYLKKRGKDPRSHCGDRWQTLVQSWKQGLCR